MKRYIRSSQVDPNYDYGGKYRYWDDPSLADNVTDIELDDRLKGDLFDSILDEMKYTEYEDESKEALWDDFVSRVTVHLQDVLEYDHPEASWPTWYEDAKKKFDEWYGTTDDSEQDRRLARSDNWRDRYEVACRTDDQDILSLLAEDSNALVRSEAACWITDPDILERLKKDPNIRVRDAASKPRGWFKRNSR